MYSIEDLLAIVKNKTNPTQTQNNVKPDVFTALVKRSSLLVTFSAQLMGFFPFSPSPNDKLSFNWLTLPVFLTAFHTIGIISMGVIFLSYDKKDRRHVNVTNVDRFGNSLWLYSTMACGVSVRLIGILCKTRMICIWEKMECILQEIYQNGTHASQIYFQAQLREYSRRTNVVYLIVYGLGISFTSRLIIPVWQVQSTSTRDALISTVTFIIIYPHVFLFITKTLCFVHIIELVTICFAVLKHEQTYVIIPEIPLKIPHNHHFVLPSLFYKHFESLENVIRFLNENFYVELIIILTHIGVLLVSILYFGYSRFLQIPNYITILDVLWFLCANLLHLILLCNASTWMTREAQDVGTQLMSNLSSDSVPNYKIQMLLMKAINSPPVVCPGYFFVVNRQLMTSLIGAITTFLIVLLQFRGS